MLELYCRDHHGPGRVPCAACDELWRYVQERLAHCPFAADKPTCLRCNVHCFRPAMRERIREVMRYAGPRITWRHPVLALRHLLDGRRPPPARRPSGRG
ncbi:MAG: nitrous oxide-stimulated promoter family protein [Deltaproteobacteria bacterium]|nr:nitrous oxide-stimulated promoter family protein [Deltaproteobacteria bacterium]